MCVCVCVCVCVRACVRAGVRDLVAMARAVVANQVLLAHVHAAGGRGSKTGEIKLNTYRCCTAVEYYYINIIVSYDYETCYSTGTRLYCVAYEITGMYMVYLYYITGRSIIYQYKARACVRAWVSDLTNLFSNTAG